jgi:hypothetical protein
MRGQATHAALICDDAEVQRLLPQVVVGDRHLLPARIHREIVDDLPDTVSLLRLPSRWMDAPLMQAIIRAIARVLRGFPDMKPVLLLDCCPAHLQEPVLRTARACAVQLIFIAAKFTWLLQPCDTHVFHAYKAAVRKKYCELRRQSPQGVVSMDAWWRVIATHAGTFMAEKDWSFAFAANGFATPRNRVSAYIMQQLEWEECPPAHEGAPAVDDLNALLPRGRRMPWALVLPPARVQPALGRGTSSTARAIAPGAAHETPPQAARMEAEPSQAPQGQPWPWRIPRAIPLPPLPPPATPPPTTPTGTHLVHATRESTQPAPSELPPTERPPLKRRRTTESLQPGAAS